MRRYKKVAGSQSQINPLWRMYHFITVKKAFRQTIMIEIARYIPCLLYTSPSPRDLSTSRMPSSA